MRISDWSSDVCSSDLVKPVSASAIRLPTDGAKAPTDVERILLGKTFSGDSGATPPRPQTSQGASEPAPATGGTAAPGRSEEHTSELQSLMRISYAVFCLKKKKKREIQTRTTPIQSNQ